jgi:hypothetical protein
MTMRRGYSARRKAAPLRFATLGVSIAAALIGALLISQQILAAHRAALFATPGVHVVHYDHTHHGPVGRRHR